jgi:hypothetical protein
MPRKTATPRPVSGSSIVDSKSKPRTGARVYAHQDEEENTETDEDGIGHELLLRFSGALIGAFGIKDPFGIQGSGIRAV